MLFDDLISSFIAGFRVFVVHSDIIRTEWPMVVCVRLSVWDHIEFIKPFSPACIEDSYQKLVLGRIVIFWLWKRNPVIGMIGHAGSKAICLDFIITLALHSRIFCTDFWYQP